MQCIYTSWCMVHLYFTRCLSDFHCASFGTKWEYVSVLMVLPSIEQCGFTLPSCHLFLWLYTVDNLLYNVLLKTSCSFSLLNSTATPLQDIHCVLWVDTESGQEKMQVKKQRSQISILGSLRQFVASPRPPLLVSIMAELSNKAALSMEGHSSPAPGTPWGRCEDKRQQRLALKPHFRWDSKSQKTCF